MLRCFRADLDADRHFLGAIAALQVRELMLPLLISAGLICRARAPVLGLYRRFFVSVSDVPPAIAALQVYPTAPGRAELHCGFEATAIPPIPTSRWGW